MTERRPAVTTLRCEGHAQQWVLPDRVLVTLTITTAVLPTPREALAAALAARERLNAHCAAAAPDSPRRDRRITVREEYGTVTEEVRDGDGTRTEQRSVVVGHVGWGTVVVEDHADRAAALVEALGGHADVASLSPSFEVSPATAASTRDVLECAAVRDARRRAALLAEAIDHHVERIVRVGGRHPQADGGGFGMAKMAMYEAGEGVGPVSELMPEPESHEATVQIVVAIAPGAAA